MFDFQISLAANHMETQMPDLLVAALASVDPSVDPLLFEDIPVNRIDLP